MRFLQSAIAGLLVAFVTSAAPTRHRPLVSDASVEDSSVSQLILSLDTQKYVNQIDKYSTVVQSSDFSLDSPSQANDPQYFAPFDGVDEKEEMEDPPVYETVSRSKNTKMKIR